NLKVIHQLRPLLSFIYCSAKDKRTDDKAIICSIIHIAKKLELQVVIEGIESTQQEQFLIGEGCDIGQGFLYGKPMPCNEFEQSLFNQNLLGGQYTYSS
ncbi:MAG: EAL domain-containing protein, partial [Pseudomonadota bacterium]